MEHKHSVFDSDTRFSINPITRQIKNDSNRKIVLIQNDHKSEVFTFECPRTVEGHSMEQCNTVEVHYLNAARDGKQYNSGLYTTEDFRVEGDKVACSWVISQNATRLVGSLNFLLVFKCVEDGSITYAWHTAIYTGISISDGINADESFEEEYVDIIAQWKAEAIQDITEAVNANVTTALQDGMTEYRAEFNQALSVERARIDNIVALPEGSTTGDAELMDIRVGADGVTYDSAGDAVRGQVANVAAEIDTIVTFERRNLIREYRMFHWSGGELSTLDTAYHTQPIFLRKGDVVYGTNVYEKYGKLSDGFLTDKDGLSLLSPKVTVSPMEKNLTVEYFTFNPIPVTGFWTFNTIEGACITKDPTHIKAGQGLYAPDGTANVVFSNLVGKSVTFNGDSICSGAGFDGGYGKIIADRFNMTYENVAQSGGTIAADTYKESTGVARHWISRSIEDMNEEADYAIIEGGVNDSSLGVPLGAISVGYNSTLDDTTFYGAFESMLKQLVTRFAGKKYGYIAVHQMANNFRIINDKETSYYWAAKKCCEKWGVPFLDLNGTLPPFNFFSAAGDPKLYALRTTYTDNGDGWHPTEVCYKDYYVPKIIKWMESL